MESQQFAHPDISQNEYLKFVLRVMPEKWESNGCFLGKNIVYFFFFFVSFFTEIVINRTHFAVHSGTMALRI